MIGNVHFWKIWADLRSKSRTLKTWGIFELCLDMGSRIKKIEFSIAVCVPLNPYLHVRWFLYPLGTVCSRNYPSMIKKKTVENLVWQCILIYFYRKQTILIWIRGTEHSNIGCTQLLWAGTKNMFLDVRCVKSPFPSMTHSLTDSTTDSITDSPTDSLTDSPTDSLTDSLAH